MASFESRLRRVWNLISERFTTPDRVLLGVCAHLARQFNVPVAVPRAVWLVLVFFYPITWSLIYVIASFFTSDVDDTL